MHTHIRAITASIAGAGVIALALTAAAAPLSATGNRQREFHATKNCEGYGGLAGQACLITSSNIPEIVFHSSVTYDQAAGVPAGLLDSNVVLDAGHGNRALGRCTLDFATSRGLCTFSDGTGTLAGFHARVDVSYISGNDWAWDGTYGFTRDDDNGR
jgi:hypothetical protein